MHHETKLTDIPRGKRGGGGSIKALQEYAIFFVPHLARRIKYFPIPIPPASPLKKNPKDLKGKEQQVNKRL